MKDSTQMSKRDNTKRQISEGNKATKHCVRAIPITTCRLYKLEIFINIIKGTWSINMRLCFIVKLQDVISRMNDDIRLFWIQSHNSKKSKTKFWFIIANFFLNKKKLAINPLVFISFFMKTTSSLRFLKQLGHVILWFWFFSWRNWNKWFFNSKIFENQSWKHFKNSNNHTTLVLVDYIVIHNPFLNLLDKFLTNNGAWRFESCLVVIVMAFNSNTLSLSSAKSTSFPASNRHTHVS